MGNIQHAKREPRPKWIVPLIVMWVLVAVSVGVIIGLLSSPQPAADRPFTSPFTVADVCKQAHPPVPCKGAFK